MSMKLRTEVWVRDINWQSSLMGKKWGPRRENQWPDTEVLPL